MGRDLDAVLAAAAEVVEAEIAASGLEGGIAKRGVGGACVAQGFGVEPELGNFAGGLNGDAGEGVREDAWIFRNSNGGIAREAWAANHVNGNGGGIGQALAAVVEVAVIIKVAEFHIFGGEHLEF